MMSGNAPLVTLLTGVIVIGLVAAGKEPGAVGDRKPDFPAIGNSTLANRTLEKCPDRHE